MNNNVVVRLDSSKVSRAVGNYSHVTKIEPNATFYTFSGQIGADLDGNLPEEFNQQVDNTFLNISNLLKSIGLTPDNVIKVNIWSTEEIDWDYFDKVYNGFFGKPSPSMTVAYVTALGLEEIKLEIEIWAAK
ncbi:enamine deaminase RidA (YjgF/YER057c/UK114 family) [Hydrogenoanaerobacterium saccharovorans]|uniref:Enamine deaminase RidA, house cleaning of reactive enamine intermediates, YjgF/YER057c/UK114 family n=1 Tax=Hydrogenoanaerobacterium saccharovorans TaxID=474960 RepID=A0A1H8AQ20_9FIRM|nr:RidA family protein [Hydrogenoanaerobacterium saccharovorans]RPF47849.1 enamine deaminase RidA (YjgF/YER057c/UK114 family) [Hydrogenoanaerobacterium saccharovorans]SEM72074.1 Enamine deaminase RidA, house cleaning of reactive enamine intermediates, YjgF/YER057c/UK114 family [Hydrogenoanaerobacterium saccharovorans]